MNKKEELLKQSEPQIDITREMKVLFDTKQYSIKIPREIERFYDLKKGDKIKLIVEIPSDKTKKPINRFEIIKGENETI